MKTFNATLGGAFNGKPLPVLVPYFDNTLKVDAVNWPGEPNRVRFDIPDNWTGGFVVKWDGKSHGGVFLVSGMTEIALYMDPGFPGAFNYSAVIEGLWPMKGATEFNLPAFMRQGADIRPILQQRKAAGANCVRSLAGGYPFRQDNGYLTMDQLRQYWDICISEGLHVLQTVFAGTAQVPGADDVGWQIGYWEQVKQVAAPYGTNVVLQLANEWNHSTQRIDPRRFQPASSNLCDHGPGLTDAHPVEPFWSVVSWHARRDVPRGITNCDCYEFEADPWPRSQPWIVGENAKPEDYGFNPEYARQMGTHCGINWGGIFHSNEGVTSVGWRPQVEVCARAFYAGIEQASA